MKNYNIYNCPSCNENEFDLMPIDNSMDGITLTFICICCDHIFSISYEYETGNITDRKIHYLIN